MTFYGIADIISDTLNIPFTMWLNGEIDKYIQVSKINEVICQSIRIIHDVQVKPKLQALKRTLHIWKFKFD